MTDADKTYLVLDDTIISKLDNLNLTLGTVTKCESNPLFAEDFYAEPPRKWEVRFDNLYPNVIIDDGVFKLWYNAFIREEASGNTPPDKRTPKLYDSGKREDGLLYATSKDGIHWTKPDLGIVSFDGSTGNNIVMSTETHGIHGVGVIKDPTDIDPDRRYKALYLENINKDKMATSFSNDGLHWSDTVHWPEFDAVGDTHNNAIRMPETGEYVGITRGWAGDKPNLYRTVLRTTSRDFVNWTEPETVLVGQNMEDQIYSMPIAPYQNLYIGLPAIFHGGDDRAANWDMVDTELAWSTDTIKWNRVLPGTALIPRGAGNYPTGEYDCGCIYAAAPVLVDDSIYLYYGGSNGLHTFFREGFFCLATLPKDRFAGYSTQESDAPGVMITEPFKFDSTGSLSLRVNAETKDGCVKVGLLDSDGRTIMGFSIDDCVITQDTPLEKKVTWSENADKLRDRSVKLQFILEGCTLFAFSGNLMPA